MRRRLGATRSTRERVRNLEGRIAAADKAKRRLVGELESLPDDEEMAVTMRATIHERFSERDAERRALVAELEELRSQQPEAPDNPALLDELPTVPVTLAGVPEVVQRELFAAFGLVVSYDKRHNRVEVCATVTTRLAGVLQQAGFDALASTPLPESTHPPSRGVAREYGGTGASVNLTCKAPTGG